MQLVTERGLATPVANTALDDSPAAEDARYAQYKVIRRNGSVVGFEPAKISIAMTKAFIAVNGGTGAASARVREQVANLTRNAVAALVRRQPSGGTFHIEDIQDQVELALMRAGEHNVARAYVLYREERAKERARDQKAQVEARRAQQAAINVNEGGRVQPLDFDRITTLVREACDGLGREVTPEPVLAAMRRDLYDGVPIEEVRKSLILAARALIEQDPGYSYVTARLLLHSLRLETLGAEVTQADMRARYAAYLPENEADAAPRLHHVAVRREDLDAMRAEIAQLAAPVVFEGEGPSIQYVLVDARKSLGHYLEYVWATPEGWAMVGWPSEAE